MNAKNWSARFVACAALIPLSTAGCGRTESAIDDGRTVAARFLDELRAGRLESAWQSTSTEFKSLMGIESLRDYVKTHPALKARSEFAESRAIDRDGLAVAECVFHATTLGRGKSVRSRINVLLASGDDGWKVEHLSIE